VDVTLPDAEEPLDAQTPDLSGLDPAEVSEKEIFREEEEGEPQREPEPAAAPPDTIGIGPSTRKLRTPLLRSTPIRGSLEDAHKKAKGRVRRGLGGRGDGLGGLRRDRILVVRGEFDQVENVLALHEIPYTLIDYDDLGSLPLRPDQMLFINCHRNRPYFKPDRFRAFVESGGWVMTSDWAVKPFLTVTFPKLVWEVDPKGHQRDTNVLVEAVHPGHPLCEGAFPGGTKVLWWLEDTSFFFNVAASRAEILVRSAEAKKRFGSSRVAFTARVGRGRVLHIMGHFYQRRGNVEGLASMHRMILNFILGKLGR